MAGAKEIRGKIASIKNTRKITKAMEMVAASKMRKAQERMRMARPVRGEDPQDHRPSSPSESRLQASVHARAAREVGRHHRDQHRSGPVRLAESEPVQGGLDRDQGSAGEDAAIHLCTIGSKAQQFFRRLAGVQIDATATHLGDRPQLKDLIGAVKVMLDGYRDAKIDRLVLVHNVFVNTMTQKAVVSQLLPLQTIDKSELQERWDYLYEPDAIEILDGYLMRYIEAQVYQGAVENVACEMAARMVAMKSATDNAGSLIDELQLIYNKARQAAITKELSEIVGGAAAV